MLSLGPATIADMTDASTLVRTMYERFQARDWARAGEVLHPEASLRLPATVELIQGRAAILAFMERYPEPWGDLAVLQVVGSDASADAGAGVAVAAEVEVVAPGATFGCAGFWQVRDGLLLQGVEYWVTVGGDQPPER